MRIPSASRDHETCISFFTNQVVAGWILFVHMPVGEMRGVTPTIVKVRTGSSRGADPSRAGPPASAASESLSPKARPASPLTDMASKPVRASLSPISSSPNAVFSRLATDGANGQALSAESRAERLAWEVRTAAATGLQPCLPHESLRPARRRAPRRLPAHPIICPPRVPSLHSLSSGASLPVGAMTVARPRPTDPGRLVRVRVRMVRVRVRVRHNVRLRVSVIAS